MVDKTLDLLITMMNDHKEESVRLRECMESSLDGVVAELASINQRLAKGEANFEILGELPPRVKAIEVGCQECRVTKKTLVQLWKGIGVAVGAVVAVAGAAAAWYEVFK